MRRMRISKSVTLMMVLLLAITMCLSYTALSISEYVLEHPLLAAGYDTNNRYETGGMIKDIPGASVNGATVTHSYNGSRRSDSPSEGGESPDQWSYFPTKYLELSSGAHDISELLFGSVESSLNVNSQNYHSHPEKRLFGLERQNYTQMSNNDTIANYVWDDEHLGRGVYLHTPNSKVGGVDHKFSTAFYVNIKLPAGATYISVSLDASYYGGAENGNARIIQSAMSIYEVPDPAFLFNGPAGSPNCSAGFKHSDDYIWSDPNNNRVNAGTTGGRHVGGTALVNGMMSGGSLKTVTRNASGALTQDAQYVRIVIANDFLTGTHGGVSIEYVLSNLKVTIEDYELASMGANMDGGQVKYQQNNNRNGGMYSSMEPTGGDEQWAYFPTRYLLPKMNSEIDLTSEMKKMIGNGPVYYPGNIDNRLFGVERSGGKYDIYGIEKQCFDIGGTTWSQYDEAKDKTNGNQIGDGISFHLRSDKRTSIAVYFTMALPEHMIAKSGDLQLNWSFNTKVFGESWNKTTVGNIYHYLSGGYAVYADTYTSTGVAVPVQAGNNRANGNSMGFNHNETWSIKRTKAPASEGFQLREDPANGLIAVPGANGVVFARPFQNPTEDYGVKISTDIPENTRFLRFVVAFDQDGISDVSKIKIALTKMKVSITEKENKSVSITPVNMQDKPVQAKQVYLRANDAGFGRPTAAVTADITLHGFNPYTGEVWSSRYDDLPTSDTGKDTIMWKTGVYEDIQVPVTSVNGQDNYVTRSGVGCNTAIYSKSANVWVTYGSLRDEQYKNTDIPGIDKGKPTDLVATSKQVTGEMASIITLKYKDQSAVTAKITGEGLINEPMSVDTYTSTATYKVTRAGTYNIVVTDAHGYINSTSVTIEYDTAPPTISDVAWTQQPYNIANITMNIVDATRVTLQGGEYASELDITMSGTAYSVNVQPQELSTTYTIRAYDVYGNVATENVTILMDLDPPTVSFSDTKAHSIGPKKIVITVEDAHMDGIVILCKKSGENVDVAYEQGEYSITATNGRYNLIIKDKFGNQVNKTIVVVNCHLGAVPTGDSSVSGVSVEVIESTVDGYIDVDEIITVRIKSLTYGRRLGVQTFAAGANVVENFNYGLESNYTVQYKTAVDDVITPVFEDIKVTYTVNNGTNSRSEQVSFGSKQTDTAYIPAGHRFVGWFDVNGVQVSDKETITLYPTRNVTIESRTTAIEEIMIRFTNMAGRTLEMRGYPNDGRSVEDIVSSVNDIATPFSPFEEFAGWQVISKSDLSNVEVRTKYTTTKQFNVVVNGVIHVKYFNDKVNLAEFADAETVGWKTSGNKTVSVTRDYVFNVTSDMTFTSLYDVANLSTDMTINTARTSLGQGAVTVITGRTNSATQYVETGFVFVYDEVGDSLMTLDSKYIMKVKTSNIHNGQIMVTVLDSAFAKTKVRMYAIDGDGKVTYSSVYSL